VLGQQLREENRQKAIRNAEKAARRREQLARSSPGAKPGPRLSVTAADAKAAEAFLNLGDLYRKQNKQREAREYYDRAIARAPGSPVAAETRRRISTTKP
jgi:tetratricopeptide (TPR) repeat protein